MEQLYINHIAVFVCAIANLALGALWYSPALFYKAWLKETDLNAEQLEKANPQKRMGWLLSLLWGYRTTWLSSWVMPTPRLSGERPRAFCQALAFLL